MVKNPPANTGEIRDAGLTLGWEDLLEEGMATHSSILVWRTQRTEDPGELQSMGHKESDTNNRDPLEIFPQDCLISYFNFLGLFFFFFFFGHGEQHINFNCKHFTKPNTYLGF